MRDPIGGFFDFELINQKQTNQSKWLFNTGRSALAFLINIHKIKKIQIPYYTCDSILEPLSEGGIDYSFYPITHELLPNYQSGEIDSSLPIIVNNYFGVLDNKLSQLDLSNTIIDNAHALFSLVKGEIGSFNSFRKFIGIPDGAEAFVGSQQYSNSVYQNLTENKSIDMLKHLFGRIENGPEAHYEDFKSAEKQLSYKNIKKISAISRRIWQVVEPGQIQIKRRENFELYHQALSNRNMLQLTDINKNITPLGYPLLTKSGTLLRKYLIDRKVFVPVLWPNKIIRLREGTWEKDLTDNLLLLPIDQRYSNEHIYVVLQMIDDYYHAG